MTRDTLQFSLLTAAAVVAKKMSLLLLTTAAVWQLQQPWMEQNKYEVRKYFIIHNACSKALLIGVQVWTATAVFVLGTYDIIRNDSLLSC